MIRLESIDIPVLSIICQIERDWCTIHTHLSRVDMYSTSIGSYTVTGHSNTLLPFHMRKKQSGSSTRPPNWIEKQVLIAPLPAYRNIKFVRSLVGKSQKNDTSTISAWIFCPLLVNKVAVIFVVLIGDSQPPYVGAVRRHQAPVLIRQTTTMSSTLSPTAGTVNGAFDSIPVMYVQPWISIQIAYKGFFGQWYRERIYVRAKSCSRPWD